MRIGIPLSVLAALLVAVGCSTTTPTKPAAQPTAATPAKTEKPEKPTPPAKAPEPKEEVSKTPSEKALLEQLGRLHRHGAMFSKRASNQMKMGLTLPEAQDVMCGTIRGLLGKNITACLVRSKADGPWESVILDLNQNKDLTDDPSYKLPPNRQSGKLTLKHNGSDRTFAVSFGQTRGMVTLTLAPTTGLTGSITFSNGTMYWVAPDDNLDRKLNPGDTVYMVTDLEGKFLAQNQILPIRMGKAARTFLNNNWYAVGINEAGDGLAVKPFYGLMYVLRIDHSKAVQPADAEQKLTIVLQDRTRLNVTIKNPKVGVRLPMGVVQSLSGKIESKPKPLTFSKSRFAVVGNTAVTLEKPTVQVGVKQSGGKIHVDQKVIVPNGIRYNLARGRKGPLVEIFKGEAKGDPLVKGNMKYG